MAQFGKASGKRGKPTYAYAIIGVALGIIFIWHCWLVFFEPQKNGRYFKENIQVHAFLISDCSQKTNR